MIARDGVAAVGHAKEVLLQGRVVGHRHAAHVVAPLGNRRDPIECARPAGIALFGAAGEELVFRRVIHGLDARRDTDQVDLVGGDPTVVGVPAVLAVAGALGDEVGPAVRRMFHRPAKIDEMRRANPDRLTFEGALAKQGRSRRARRLRPRASEVRRPPKADKGPHPGPVVGDPVTIDAPARMQAVGAVVPDTLVHQAPARVTALVRARAGLEDPVVRDDQAQRILAEYRGVTGGCPLAAGRGAQTVHVAVGPGRVEVPIRRPGWIPGVGARILGMTSGEGQAHEALRFRKGAIRGRLARPRLECVGRRQRRGVHPIEADLGIVRPKQTKGEQAVHEHKSEKRHGKSEGEEEPVPRPRCFAFHEVVSQNGMDGSSVNRFPSKCPFPRHISSKTCDSKTCGAIQSTVHLVVVGVLPAR